MRTHLIPTTLPALLVTLTLLAGPAWAAAEDYEAGEGWSESKEDEGGETKGGEATAEPGTFWYGGEAWLACTDVTSSQGGPPEPYSYSTKVKVGEGTSDWTPVGESVALTAFYRHTNSSDDTQNAEMNVTINESENESTSETESETESSSNEAGGSVTVGGEGGIPIFKTSMHVTVGYKRTWGGSSTNSSTHSQGTSSGTSTSATVSAPVGAGVTVMHRLMARLLRKGKWEDWKTCHTTETWVPVTNPNEAPGGDVCYGTFNGRLYKKVVKTSCGPVERKWLEGGEATLEFFIHCQAPPAQGGKRANKATASAAPPSLDVIIPGALPGGSTLLAQSIVFADGLPLNELSAVAMTVEGFTDPGAEVFVLGVGTDGVTDLHVLTADATSGQFGADVHALTWHSAGVAVFSDADLLTLDVY